MVGRMVLVGLAIATTLLLFGPFSVPGWVVAAFVLTVGLMAILATPKRMRTERRLARAIWHALTGSGPS